MLFAMTNKQEHELRSSEKNLAVREHPSVVTPAKRYSGRIGGIDIARALAVVGMFWAHLGFEGEFGTVSELLLNIPDGRSSVLFALLAGISVSILTGRNIPYTGHDMRAARLRITGRALFLLALGSFLDILGTPVIVILGFYGFWFLLTLPFTSLSARKLAILAGTLGAVGPFVIIFLKSAATALNFMPGQPANSGFFDAVAWGMYPGLQYMAFVFAGMAIGRLDLRRRRTQLWLLWLGSVCALIGYLAANILSLLFGTGSTVRNMPWDTLSSSDYVEPTGWVWPDADYLFTAEPHTGTVWETIGSGGFAIAVLAACLLVGKLSQTVLYPVAALGAMPLTSYSWHIVALYFLPDIIFTGEAGPFLWITLITLVFCSIWKLTVGRGPLEWLMWRFAAAVAGTPTAERSESGRAPSSSVHNFSDRVPAASPALGSDTKDNVRDTRGEEGNPNAKGNREPAERWLNEQHHRGN